MHGNVLEWVQDWYVKDYYQKRQNPDVDPQGPEKGDSRVLRGGSSLLVQGFARCAFRLRDLPVYTDGDCGVRVVVLP